MDLKMWNSFKGEMDKDAGVKNIGAAFAGAARKGVAGPARSLAAMLGMSGHKAVSTSAGRQVIKDALKAHWTSMSPAEQKALAAMGLGGVGVAGVGAGMAMHKKASSSAIEAAEEAGNHKSSKLSDLKADVKAKVAPVVGKAKKAGKKAVEALEEGAEKAKELGSKGVEAAKPLLSKLKDVATGKQVREAVTTFRSLPSHLPAGIKGQAVKDLAIKGLKGAGKTGLLYGGAALAGGGLYKALKSKKSDKE